MRKIPCLLLLFPAMSVNTTVALAQQPAGYFNPLITSDSKYEMSNGNTFTIAALQNNQKSSYISSSRLNGKDWTRNYILRADIIKGRKTEFTMSDQPEKKRGTLETDYPFSLSE